MNRKGRPLDVDFEKSGSQSLLVIMGSKVCPSSVLERKFFAVESKFLSIYFPQWQVMSKVSAVP